MFALIWRFSNVYKESVKAKAAFMEDPRGRLEIIALLLRHAFDAFIQCYGNQRNNSRMC